MHHQFKQESLSKKNIGNEPFELFFRWVQDARKAGVSEFDAMVLSTSNGKGLLSSRIVYLRDWEDKKIHFYTNYESRKGQQLKNHSRVAINLFWKEIERQVRIEGIASKLSEEESEKYFKDRPRGSQIGAWASAQSQTIKCRSKLEEKFNDFDQQFTGKEIPKPEHWGGYSIEADYFEFWQGRDNRLHDRIEFQRIIDQWQITRLQP